MHESLSGPLTERLVGVYVFPLTELVFGVLATRHAGGARGSTCTRGGGREGGAGGGGRTFLGCVFRCRLCAAGAQANQGKLSRISMHEG